MTEIAWNVQCQCRRYLAREIVDVFLQLPAPQRKLIREVILTFAKVHQGGAAPHDASAGPVRSE